MDTTINTANVQDSVENHTWTNGGEELIAEKENKFKSDELRPLSFYQQEIKKMLPKETFVRDPFRVSYMFMFIILNTVAIYSVLNFEIHWVFKLLIGIAMGHFNGGAAFIAHETLHGSILKKKWHQDVVGFICFAPFMISPTYWRYWHNYLHHGNTQLLIRDPDAFPTHGVYKKSKFMQKIYPLLPGSRTIRSYFYFFYWFSYQAFLNQASMRFGNKMWDKMNHKRVTIEFVSQILLVAGFLYLIGPSQWLWLALVPFAVQNYVVMSYISTNHNISPLTKVNDPLVNSLTVTTNPVQDFFHLNFGYHVEHHLFPRMSARHAKKVHAKIKERFPEKFKVMKKSDALKILYSTPRIYKGYTELICPKTQKTYKTI